MPQPAFSTEVRVRFADTDAQGIAHNANFAVWFEVGRVEYMRARTGGYQRVREQGIEALVLETHVRHHRPVFFDDVLEVQVRCSDVRGARFRFDYRVERSGELVVDGWTMHACVDAASFRPIRVPAWLRDALASAEQSSSASASSP
jgi:acyl-CoA thioester hydrolase